MSDVAPILLPLADPPRRDRRIVVTAIASAALHLVVLGLVLLPWAQPKAPAEPQSIAVELVPAPSEVSSAEPPPSASQDSSSADASSSEAPSSAETSSQQPSSGEPASSAEPPSSTEPSAASSTPPPPSEASAQPPSDASSEEPSSAAEAASSAASTSAPPVPPARPVVIPAGPTASSEPESSAADDASASASDAGSAPSSAEASSAPEAASDEVLTASGAEASDGVDQGGASSGPSEVATLADGPPPPAEDMLHAAKRFYLSDMLDQPALTKARAALKKLPPEKRLAQTCNIEVIGQIGNAGRGLQPDAVVANAFAAPSVSDGSYTVSNGAFRSGQKWYGIAYECTLSKDMTAVTSFKFDIGDDVTDSMVARYGKN